MRRLLQLLGIYSIDIAKPVRVWRNRVVKPGELESAVSLARLRPNCSAIMIVLDADDDCPRELAPELLRRARQTVQNMPISMVMPNSELEAWFVGSIESLRGERSIRGTAVSPSDPESIRDAKRWLRKEMSGSRTYMAVDDQPAFAERFDLDRAYEQCRSFRKFREDFETMVNALRPVE